MTLSVKGGGAGPSQPDLFITVGAGVDAKTSANGKLKNLGGNSKLFTDRGDTDLSPPRLAWWGLTLFQQPPVFDGCSQMLGHEPT